MATPALTRSVLGDVAIPYYGVQVQGGASYVPDVEREFTAKEHYFTDFLIASQHREYVITQPDTPLPWINYLGC